MAGVTQVEGTRSEIYYLPNEEHNMIKGWVNPEEDRRLYEMGKRNALGHLKMSADLSRRSYHNEVKYILETYPDPEKGDHYAAGFMDGMRALSQLSEPILRELVSAEEITGEEIEI